MRIFFALFFFLTTLSAAEEAPPKEAASKELVIEQTLAMIKPDAVESNQLGEILEYYENAGLRVVAAKLTHLTESQAKAFYAAHKEKAFYTDLVHFMTSGPVLALVLEGEDAIAVNRQVMGDTDPHKASAGTLRADFGTDVQRNAVHGSDSPDSAKKEIAFFFKPEDIFSHDR